MGDGLIISGGGSIEVATDLLFDRARRLENAETELRGALAELLLIARGVTPAMLRAPDAPHSAARAERRIDDALILIASTADKGGRLASALHTAAAAYGAAEKSSARASEAVWADLGWAAGVVARSVAPLFALAAAGTALGAYAGYRLMNAVSPDAVAGARDVAGAVGRLAITDPRFVQLLRLGAMSADDAAAGALGEPRSVDRILGDEGLGITGLDTAAAGVVGLGAAAGMFVETPVSVRQASVRQEVPVAGIAGRANRIPTGGNQVRIDRYSSPGRDDRFEVYIGGTIDFSPTAGGEPFDLTSNLHGIAGSDPGSYRVVQEALDAEGVPRGATLVVTGYSQGGLLGAQLAASGDYDVTGLVTFGAPAGQVRVPAHVPWVAVEHSDDLVPALGGSFVSDDAIVVRREAFEGDSTDARYAVPAHQLKYYRETAALVDGANESRLAAANAALDGDAVAPQWVTSTTYRGDRLPSG